MKIIIVGAGKVGNTITEFLAQEDHDVVIIDINNKAVNEAINNYDIRGVIGNGASYDVLLEAGANKADILIACTSSDELNILSCLVGQKTGIPNTIARVRNPEYSNQIDFLYQELGINLIVNPEYAAANEISRILRFPSATKIDTFAKDRVEIVEFKIAENSRIANKSLSQIRKEMQITFLICAVERDSKVYIPDGNFIIQEKDKIYVTASRTDITLFFKQLGLYLNRARNVIIVGGSKITYYLAKQLLDSKSEVKIIEVDQRRAVEFSELLPNAKIIAGDGSNQDLLIEEGIEKADALVTLTGFDEENIIISLFAEKLKVPRVITKVNRDAYHDILGSIGLESIISPKSLTAYQILRYVRSLENTMHSQVQTLYKLVNDQVEAVEFYINNETEYTNIKFKDLKLPRNTLIASIIRDKKVIIPNGEDCLKAKDSVVIVTMDRHLRALEDIFR
jgi:trk system potassium uptake protein TrkA